MREKPTSANQQSSLYDESLQNVGKRKLIETWWKRRLGGLEVGAGEHLRQLWEVAVAAGALVPRSGRRRQTWQAVGHSVEEVEDAALEDAALTPQIWPQIAGRRVEEVDAIALEGAALEASEVEAWRRPREWHGGGRARGRRAHLPVVRGPLDKEERGGGRRPPALLACWGRGGAYMEDS